ncbi:MAG TPA: NADH-quinone oxidoreductase subunit L [Acidimicrobiales bacterium]|nr:NADH-quinone oxidoreductase subunit L [Acidimicrobiales bacterium]
MWFMQHAWLIPLIPAVSFWLILFFGKRLPFKGAEIGVTAISASFVLALCTAYQWIQRVDDAKSANEGLLGAFGRSVITPLAEEHRPVVAPVIKSVSWFDIGGVKWPIGSQVDGLVAAMVVMVTIVSLLVHIFSLEYMRGDRRFTHFFAALSLFTCGMLTLVTSVSTIQMILGWEIMGLCSFMLIGHWWEEYPNARAALKAFFTTRTGDIGLLVGVSIVFFGTGTFSIIETNTKIVDGQVSHLLLLMGAIALFVAVIGKSGQFPLHTWLPDAMAGPTPVSALIHAATMVVAGVYLVARLYPVFFEGFKISSGGMNPMAIIGGVTILIAAALAFVQNDIKKVLAYSTVSQLGYMVMALGVGAWTAGVFHIFTHAFFKALLFLAAGSVSHSGSHHSFDMKKDMGGLRKYMPITFWTFIIGTLALVGFFPFAGFWSKDEILANADSHGFVWFMVIGFIGAFMTAAYMTRCVYLTFFGEYRGGHSHEGELEHDTHVTAHEVEVEHAEELAHAGPHESGPLLTVPLIILAVLSTVAGFLNWAAWPFHSEKFSEWFEPSTGQPDLEHATFAYGKAALSLFLVICAIAFVSYLMANDFAFLKNLTRRSKVARAGYVFLVNKYYLDYLYENIIVAAISGPIARANYWFNQNVIDAVVNRTASTTREVGNFVYRRVDQGVVDRGINGAGEAAEGAGGVLRLLQSGKVQQYGALLFGAAALGALALVIIV